MLRVAIGSTFARSRTWVAAKPRLRLLLHTHPLSPRLFPRTLHSPSRNTSTAMATPFLIALGALSAGFGGRYAMQRIAAKGAKSGMDAWVKGGFQSKMDPKEAKQILGIKYVLSALVR